jgi:NADPH:quinone reductase-like Zn-dependent oxidoreductase
VFNSKPGEKAMMRALRLHSPGGFDALSVDEIEAPHPGPGEALVRVQAAAITRDELDWPTDRLPAIVSYELSGVVEEVAGDVWDLAIGDEVFALTPFDRDGVAAEQAVVPAAFLAPKPMGLSHVESAAIPLAGLTAWQGLFVHGELQPNQRVLILGAAGGVGHLATQLAAWRGAHVIGTASAATAELAHKFGAQVLDTTATLVGSVEPVDVVFDTLGGDALARSVDVLREGGRLVAVAEEPPPEIAERVHATYFVVEPDREQLVQLAGLANDGILRPAIDSVFPLEYGRAAFDRVMSSGKRGKVVIEVDHA